MALSARDRRSRPSSGRTQTRKRRDVTGGGRGGEEERWAGVPRPGCDALARDMGEHEQVVGNNSICHTTYYLTSNKHGSEALRPSRQGGNGVGAFQRFSLAEQVIRRPPLQRFKRAEKQTWCRETSSSLPS